MNSEILKSFEQWVRTLPILHLARKETPIKNVLWRAYTPLHPAMRGMVVSLSLMRHPSRQQFLFGTLKKDKSPIEFIQYLLSHRYGKHKIAWKDTGELIGVRKIENGGSHQYHIRLFENGEVRGHYEHTPEYHVRWHLREVGMEERRDYFMSLLREWLE